MPNKTLTHYLLQLVSKKLELQELLYTMQNLCCNIAILLIENLRKAEIIDFFTKKYSLHNHIVIMKKTTNIITAIVFYYLMIL